MGGYEARMREFRNPTERTVAHYVMVEADEVGDGAEGDVRLEGVAEIPDHIRGPGGGVAVGALLTMADNAAGLTGGLAALPDNWVVTTSLMFEHVRPTAVGPLGFETSILRAGRQAIVSRVGYVDLGADRAPVAEVVLTSAVLHPDGGAPKIERPARMVPARVPDPGRAFLPFADFIGIEVDASGRYVLEGRSEFGNPWGFLHGGVVASLIDASAMGAAAPRLEGPGVVTSALVNYLAPNRVGPIVAHHRVVGPRGRGVVVRVELHDEGAGGRRTVVATVTVDPLD